MTYRRKQSPVEAVQIAKGMKIPDWLASYIELGYIGVYGTCPYTSDAPYAIDEIHNSHGIAGEYIVLENNKLSFITEAGFHHRYEPVETESE